MTTTIQGKSYSVDIQDLENGKIKVTIPGKLMPLSITFGSTEVAKRFFKNIIAQIRIHEKSK